MCTPKFEHRLHILTKERCFDRQVLWKISFNDLLDLKENFFQLIYMLTLVLQVQHTNLKHIHFFAIHLDDRKAQDVGAGIDAKDAGRCLFQLCQLKVV